MSPAGGAGAGQAAAEGGAEAAEVLGCLSVQQPAARQQGSKAADKGTKLPRPVVTQQQLAARQMSAACEYGTVDGWELA
jgi:hypothetical protein